MNITHGTAPLEVKRPKVQQLDAVITKLRAVRNGALLRPIPSSDKRAADSFGELRDLVYGY